MLSVPGVIFGFHQTAVSDSHSEILENYPQEFLHNSRARTDHNPDEPTQTIVGATT
jgi:hypothetical protein